MNLSKGKNRLLIFAVLAVVFCGSSWIVVSRAVAENKCITCHRDKQNAKYAHPPAHDGMCDVCHQVTKKHLKNGGSTGVKTQPVPAVCYQCHGRKDKGKNVHPALKLDGSCTNCHNPHGSANPYFLVAPMNKICFECHDPVPPGAAKGSEHAPVTDKKSCLNCHNPHSSNHEHLLLATPKKLCLSCHDKKIVVKNGKKTRILPNIKKKVNSRYVHEPASEDDGCLYCHNPHGSKYKDLFKAHFPVSIYNKYNPGKGKTPNTYALCFTCHDPSKLNKKIGYDTTGFQNDTMRNGKVVRLNLHWWHVVNAAGDANKNRGRSCIICHSPHGANQPHLLRSLWTMKNFHPVLEYKALPHGGECLRSCHAPKRYRRLK